MPLTKLNTVVGANVVEVSKTSWRLVGVILDEDLGYADLTLGTDRAIAVATQVTKSDLKEIITALKMLAAKLKDPDAKQT